MIKRHGLNVLGMFLHASDPQFPHIEYVGTIVLSCIRKPLPPLLISDQVVTPNGSQG